MRKQEKEFLDRVKRECRENGVKCSLRPVSYLKLSGNIKCSGYFDDSRSILAVAMKKPQAIEILVHEYSHMNQWKEGVEVWKKGTVAVEKIDRWLAGKRVRDIEEAFSDAIALELDNEKRSVRAIKKFGLNIDTEIYTKKANAYLQFYLWLKETRRWSKPGNSPYENGSLVNSMPSNFRMNYHSLSSRVRKIFEREEI